MNNFRTHSGTDTFHKLRCVHFNWLRAQTQLTTLMFPPKLELLSNLLPTLNIRRPKMFHTSEQAFSKLSEHESDGERTCPQRVPSVISLISSVLISNPQKKKLSLLRTPVKAKRTSLSSASTTKLVHQRTIPD